MIIHGLGSDIGSLQSDLTRLDLTDPKKNAGLITLCNLLVRSRLCRVHSLLRISTGRNPRFASVARLFLSKFYHIELGADVAIGRAFVMPHPINIVIGGEVVMGDNVTIDQNVTIGGNFKKSRIVDGIERKVPVLGDRVWVASGAVVAGPVTVGSDVVVGANAVVTRDVPANSLVYGQNCISRRKIIIDHPGSYRVLD